MQQTEYKPGDIITMDQAEFINLIRTGNTGVVQFGPSGTWIEWPEGQDMPENFRKVLELRGYFNKNVSGDGI